MRARGIIRSLKADIEGRPNQVAARLDEVVRSAGRGRTAIAELGTEWQRLGSNQVRWRHFQGMPGSQGGSLVDSGVKALATYHALRVTIFSVASASQLFAEHMEKSGKAGQTLHSVARAIETSFTNASHSLHGLVETVFRNVYNVAVGDNSAARDHAADAAAQRARMRLYRQQLQYRDYLMERARIEEALGREERERRAGQFEAMKQRERELADMRFQLEERNWGANERRIRERSYLNKTTIDRELLDQARATDLELAKRRKWADLLQQGSGLRDEWNDLQRSRAEELDLQRVAAMQGPSGGAGMVLGSREEYQARLRAEQRDNPNAREQRAHQQKVERLLEKLGELQRMQLRFLETPNAVSIPGAA